jgi:hypothetical protein
MPLPSDFHDEGVYYRVRLCIRVEDDPIVGFITQSVVSVCASCGEAVWMNDKQELPPMPEGVEVKSDLLICFQCFKREAGEGEVSTLTETTAAALRSMGFKAQDPLT